MLAIVDARTLLAGCAVVVLLAWLWVSVLCDWLECWHSRRVTADMLGKLVIASAVSTILVLAAVSR